MAATAPHLQSGVSNQASVQVILKEEDIKDPVLCRLYYTTVVLKLYLAQATRIAGEDSKNVLQVRADLHDRDIIKYIHELAVLLIAFRDTRQDGADARTPGQERTSQQASHLLATVSDQMVTAIRLLGAAPPNWDKSDLILYTKRLTTRTQKSVFASEKEYWAAATATGVSAVMLEMQSALEKVIRNQDSKQQRVNIPVKQLVPSTSQLVKGSVISPAPVMPPIALVSTSNPAKRKIDSKSDSERPSQDFKRYKAASQVVQEARFAPPPVETGREEVDIWQENWAIFLATCDSITGKFTIANAQELELLEDPLLPLVVQFGELNRALEGFEHRTLQLLNDQEEAQNEVRTLGGNHAADIIPFPSADGSSFSVTLL